MNECETIMPWFRRRYVIEHGLPTNNDFVLHFEGNRYELTYVGGEWQKEAKFPLWHRPQAKRALRKALGYTPARVIDTHTNQEVYRGDLDDCRRQIRILKRARREDDPKILAAIIDGLVRAHFHTSITASWRIAPSGDAFDVIDGAGTTIATGLTREAATLLIRLPAKILGNPPS